MRSGRRAILLGLLPVQQLCRPFQLHRPHPHRVHGRQVHPGLRAHSGQHLRSFPQSRFSPITMTIMTMMLGVGNNNRVVRPRFLPVHSLILCFQTISMVTKLMVVMMMEQRQYLRTPLRAPHQLPAPGLHPVSGRLGLTGRLGVPGPPQVLGQHPVSFLLFQILQQMTVVALMTMPHHCHHRPFWR